MKILSHKIPQQVTGSQTLKLVHDKFKGKPPAMVLRELAADMAPASEGNREILQHLGKAMEDLSALRVRAWGLFILFFLGGILGLQSYWRGSCDCDRNCFIDYRDCELLRKKQSAKTP